MIKKIIWSLFDSETAITQKLNNDKYKVYSIGLPSSSAITDNFIKIDLSKKSCIKKLEKLPKPDIIFASPPCETWVDVNIGNVWRYNRTFNEHNLYWKKNWKPNNYAPHHRKNRLNGQKTAYHTYQIIKHFKPEIWVIENGQNSLIFKYLYTFFKLKGFKNRTYYSAYDHINFSVKPTIFYSNKKFFLRTNKVKSKKIISINSNLSKKIKKNLVDRTDIELKKNYCERSEVPLQIYIDILNQIETPLTFDFI